MSITCKIWYSFSYLCSAIVSFVSGIFKVEKEVEENNMKSNCYNGQPDKSVLISSEVLDDFRENAGRYKAETGGMLASSNNENRIDVCYFDSISKNTPGTFYYDVESMSAVFREWKAKGYITNGIYHSHPRGVIHPSYHDISSALLHMDFFKLDYFYLPILQPEKRGFYSLYFYVVRRVENYLNVSLHYVLEAHSDGYRYAPFRAWDKKYQISQLKSYRASIENNIENKTDHNDRNADMDNNAFVDSKEKNEREASQIISAHETESRNYFEKVSKLYPNHVLDKVIVCVGTGGARSFLENCARSGFRNYVLIDKDVVSPSNVATQGVFISEMGKKKVDVIKQRILDINPDAKVICVDRFLDDNMSDEEFKGYMDVFPNKKPTDYLILGCTDNFEAQKRSSLLALKYGSPYLAAMMYKDGAAAEIIFVYPGVTESCPRCLLRDRFEKYENGFINDVDSSSCPIFATERMNALKGYIALMLLMYHEDEHSLFNNMLDEVKNRNFVEIRLNPYLKDTELGINLFDKVFEDSSRYVFFDETLWIPQHPDRPEFGTESCKLCEGKGDLIRLQDLWKQTDTRGIVFKRKSA